METTTTPTQKSHQNIFLLILKVVVGVMTVATDPQLIFHFHNASFFPKISSSRKANSPPFFPEKTGQKSP